MFANTAKQNPQNAVGSMVREMLILDGWQQIIVTRRLVYPLLFVLSVFIFRRLVSRSFCVDLFFLLFP